MVKSKEEQKEQVIQEYLSGGTSRRKLGLKYGYNPSTVSRWVVADKKEKHKLVLLQSAKFAVLEQEEMPATIKQLQEALRDSRLKISLLEAMIDISDERFGPE